MTQPEFKLFTPGPTPMAEHIRRVAARPLPYNRTEDFSQFTHGLIRRLKSLLDTRGEVAIFTASGTGAMEAAVQNFLGTDERVLVVNGGVFGRRWAELCAMAGVPHDELAVPPGRDVAPERIERELRTGRYSALLVTAHETSTGALCDVAAIGEVARRHGALYVVDAISTVGADPFRMDDWQVDVAVFSSHKALAIPPGLSFLALSEAAQQRLATVPPRSMYFRVADYLKNQQRGQMPFTPAVGLFLSLDARLAEIESVGLDAFQARHRRRAEHFRAGLAGLPLRMFPERPSNALTAVACDEAVDAGDLVRTLAREYRIIVAPNGPPFEQHLFRVGHLGDQLPGDADLLLTALNQLLTTSHTRLVGAA